MKVVINDGTMGRFLATDRTMQKGLAAAAEHLMEAATEKAPVGTSAAWGPFRGVHGYYRRRFRLAVYRGGYRVWNDDPFAHLVEWGSINNSPYSPIRRAVHESGLRYVPDPTSRGA